VHVSNELAQSVFPLDVRLSLYSLISIAHHGDQEINEHHHRHQHVNAEGELEENGRPLGLHCLYLELFVCRLTEDGEEQQLDREYGIHPDCKYVLMRLMRSFLYARRAYTYARFSATAQIHAKRCHYETSQKQSVSSHTMVCCNSRALLGSVVEKSSSA